MGYTTVTKVRQSAGFVGNTNLTDSFIANKIKQAENKINSYIGDRYILPLPKYYFNQITFSGTGGITPATMTITIDGINYLLSITAGMTAAEAADAFRVAASASTSFVIDSLGDGVTITIYSIDGDDSTQVTISTATQTVNGITATNGTVTETSVPFIESLATDIAIAQLFIVEYGQESANTDKDGYKLLALATGTLEDIQKKKEKLYDFNGAELPENTGFGLKFFPTTVSKTDSENPTENRFKMNQDF